MENYSHVTWPLVHFHTRSLITWFVPNKLRWPLERVKLRLFEMRRWHDFFSSFWSSKNNFAITSSRSQLGPYGRKVYAQPRFDVTIVIWHIHAMLESTLQNTSHPSVRIYISLTATGFGLRFFEILLFWHLEKNASPKFCNTAALFCVTSKRPWLWPSTRNITKPVELIRVLNSL